MESKIQICDLSNSGDGRGFSFTAPADAAAFLKTVNDVHMASIQPGAIRGNHYHLRRREAIVVFPGTPMTRQRVSREKSYEIDEYPQMPTLQLPMTPAHRRNSRTRYAWV